MFKIVKEGTFSLVTLYVLFCAYFFVEVMRGFTQYTSVSSSRIIPLLIILGLGCFVKKNDLDSTSLTKVSILFGGYLSLVTFFDLDINATAFSNVFSVFLWIIVLKQVSSMEIDINKLEIIILLMSIMCNIISSIYVFDIVPKIQYMEHIQRIGAINSIYYILITFPFVFLFRNWLWSVFFSLLPLFAFMISGKTTCILCGIAILCFYIFKNLMNIELKSRILFILVVVLLCWIVSPYIDFTTLLDNSHEDFSTGGNGRAEIMRKVLYLLIYVSNTSSIIFGHGVNAISRTIGIGGHNDFLEVLYCYGLIGLFLFIAFLIYLIKEIRMLLSNTHRIAFSISIIILFFALSASKLIATQIGLLPLSIFWGTLLAYSRTESEYI